MRGRVFKIVPAGAWAAAADAGGFAGSPVDLADGYIHLSSSHQVEETARRHFAGQRDLVLVAYDGDSLGDSLRYEISRGGEPFPHFYGMLDPALALWTRPLPLGSDGRHVFPNLAE